MLILVVLEKAVMILMMKIMLDDADNGDGCVDADTREYHGLFLLQIIGKTMMLG